MTLINIPSLIPQRGKFIAKHPVTGETEFETTSGEKVQLILYIVGRNSNEWLDFMKAVSDKGELKPGELFNRISEKSKEFIASLIVDWENNGAIKESYSKENALKLVSEPNNIWLLEQLQEFLLNEKNFFFTGN